MANQLANSKPKFSVAITQPNIKAMINNTLGNEEVATKFIADITTVVSQNPALSSCDVGSVLSAGFMAQALKLPLASTLGCAYIIPYGSKAQFQLGYKGLIQLAMRSGQFKRIGVREVHKGEYKGQDEFGDDMFNFSHEYDNNETIGYFAYFVLTNGFQKTEYWTKEQVDKHAHTYSKSYGNGTATDNWTKMFSKMACKTVLKSLLNVYAPKSVDMIKAMEVDQAVIREDGTPDYVDNATNQPSLEEQSETPVALNEEEQKILEDLQ